MTHHLPAAGSSWAITDTANKGVTFARGMLEAATSDNINPVALVCCEAFGALLPLCLETRVKVEQLARRNHTSHVLNFIKAQIGYRKGDSVEHLSRSDSGIRFLCLAATFCTLDLYDAANRLDSLLRATQKEQQMRPTLRQLQVMLNTFRTKMTLSDYANTVASCEIFMRAALASAGSEFTVDVAQVPPKPSLEAVIFAMNELGRLGDITSIEIKLESQYVPWIWAFVQWCLGVSPHVRTSTGEILLFQKEPLVILTIMARITSQNTRKRRFDTINDQIQVSVRHEMRSLKEIVFHEDVDSKKWAWEGLVSVETWVRYKFAILFERFPHLHADKKLKRAVGQAFFFIVGCLPEKLILCDDYKALILGMQEVDGSFEKLLNQNSPKPFLDSENRLQITRHLIKEYIDLVHDECDAQSTLAPLNLSQLLGGSCKLCLSGPNRILGGTLPCKVHELLEMIGTIGSALLIFTLFGPMAETYPMVLAGEKFHTTQFHHRLMPYKTSPAIISNNWTKLVTTGWQALMHKKCAILSCPPIAIFKCAAQLMGHQKIRDSTIVSSKSGQVVYPAFFEATDFMRNGFIQLCAFPGKLNKDDMQFDFFLDSWSDTIQTQGLSDADSEEIDSEIEGEDEGDNENENENENMNEEESTTSQGQTEQMVVDDASPGPTGSELDVGEQNAEEVLQPDDVEIATQSNIQTVPRTFSVDRRPTFFEEDVMKWRVAVHDDMLRGELFLQANEQPTMAWSLIESLARCHLTPACQHRRRYPAGEIGDEFLFSKGSAVRLRGADEPRILFALGCGYSDQLASLETQDYYPATIVHVEGCIRCALALCLDSDSRVVIS
jgi:hypothetical protein